jgi:hypothetical protein
MNKTINGLISVQSIQALCTVGTQSIQALCTVGTQSLCSVETRINKQEKYGRGII